jgi:hypothetical protein
LPNAATLRPIVDYGRLSPRVPPTPVAACLPLPWVFLLDQAKLVFCSARRLMHRSPGLCPQAGGGDDDVFPLWEGFASVDDGELL